MDTLHAVDFPESVHSLGRCVGCRTASAFPGSPNIDYVGSTPAGVLDAPIREHDIDHSVSPAAASTNDHRRFWFVTDQDSPPMPLLEGTEVRTAEYNALS